MFESLLLVNLPSGSQLPRDLEGVSWKTCLRQIYFGRLEEAKFFDHEAQVYRSKEAFQFLLEVICGLHSSMVAETEVYGQFKQFFLNESLFKGRQELAAWKLAMVQADTLAKQVRTKHLIGLGSHTYGSVVRRQTKSLKEVHIIGSGLLVKNILPWLKKTDHSIFVYARNPLKAQSELQGQVEILKLQGQVQTTVQNSAALVIAAPLTADEVGQMFDLSVFAQIIDLRGESKKDSLTTNTSYLVLSEIFSVIEQTKGIARKKIELAQTEIKKLTEEHYNKDLIRPFGWEDLCVLG